MTVGESERDDGMCYSPEADLIAGIVVGAIGIDALRHVGRRRDLAVAGIPVVLAAHQLIEAVAWWGLDRTVPSSAGNVAVTAYLLIALVALPVLVPYAVMQTEPVRGVRRTMAVFVVLGVLVSTVALTELITHPLGATIGGRFIEYGTTFPGGGMVTVLCAVVACAPFLMSSHRRFVIFGIINVPVVVLLAILLPMGLIPLWCIWAAVTSVVIAYHVRKSATVRHDVLPVESVSRRRLRSI